MVDIHCHIAPNVDDGAKDMEEAIKMAKMAYQNGTKKIINTSHFYDTTQFVTGEKLKEQIEKLNKRLKEEDIDIEIMTGNEAYISPELPKLLDESKVFTLTGSKYLLMELPMQEIPIYTESIIYDLRLRGIIPIIAHPERYAEVIKNPKVVYDLIGQGVLMQVNGGSFRGRFGEDSRQTAEILLKHNMIHFVGSDGHSSRSRRPVLKEAFERVVDLVGEEYAGKLFYENPKSVIENKDIEILQPLEIEEKKKRVGFFKKLFMRKAMA